MLEIDDVKRSFVCHPVEIDEITIFCLANELLVLEASCRHQVLHRPSVRVLS